MPNAEGIPPQHSHR